MILCLLYPFMSRNIRFTIILNKEKNIMNEIRRDYCINCRKETTYTLKKQEIRKVIKDKEYTFLITVAVCNECNEEISVPGLLDLNIKEIDSQ